MRFFSLRTKILLMTIGLLTILGLAAGVFIKAGFSEQLVAELQKRGVSIAKQLAENSASDTLAEDMLTLRIAAYNQKKIEEDIAYIIFLDVRGDRVLAHTFGDTFPVDLSAVNSFEPGQEYNIARIITEHGPIYDVAVPMFKGGKAQVRLGISGRSVERAVEKITGQVLTITLALLVLGALIAFPLTQTLVKPVRHLTEAAEAVAGGELDLAVKVGTRDEIGLLASAFNRMTQNLKRAHTELEEANLELNAFVYTVSHDLRTPLTLIIGYADILGENCRDKLDEQALDWLAEISASGEKMVALMEDLLVLAKTGKVERPAEPLDTGEVVNDVVRALADPIARAGVAVEVGDLPPLRLPKTLVSQIFDNLVGNSVRYAGSEGRPVEVGGERSGDLVRYYVRDHGPGILEKERSRIFEVFYRGAEGKKIPGSGVGLATVQKIARLYGGRVWVEETEGGGSTFWVEMLDVPAAAENEEDTL